MWMPPGCPLAEPSPWYVLLEVSSAQGEQAASRGHRRRARSRAGAGHASDAALSASVAQFRSLWALREDISESQGAEGPTIKHDICAADLAHSRLHRRAPMPPSRSDFPGLRLVVFGHLGDGNLHYNMSPPAEGMDRDAGFLALEAPDEPAGA